MKKITMILLALLISVALFADVSGSVASTSVFDADAETLKETVATTVSVGPLTFLNTFYLTELLTEDAAFRWGSAINYAVNEAITVGIKSGYGVESDIATAREDGIPLVLLGSWKVADFFSISANYTNDNLNPPDGEAVEKGSFTLGATFTF